jgi:xylulose-5-phosphate/fructose-6-phosphate phosphoketolase
MSKGWGGPKKIHGEFIEGSFHSHQVPLPAAKTDEDERAALQHWLSSYMPKELFKDNGDVTNEIKSVIPRGDKKLGQRRVVFDGYESPKRVDWKEFCVKKGGQESCMKTVGQLLDKYLVENPDRLRVFSPDELVSNKLDAIFEHTGRNFQWDQFSNARGGRVIETLSEHQCQGFLQGYTLTGRVGVFASYESFLGIIQTMMVQYSKFNKMVTLSCLVTSNLLLTDLTGKRIKVARRYR